MGATRTNSNEKSRRKKTAMTLEHRREGGPAAAAFAPPSPRPAPTRGPGGLQASLGEFAASLAASACGESAAEMRFPLSFVAARDRLCSALMGRDHASSSLLLVLSFFVALVGAIAYLSLLAVGRARR